MVFIKRPKPSREEPSGSEELTAAAQDETGAMMQTGAAVEKDGVRTPIDPDSIVSMNMWALTPDFMEELKEGFPKFLAGVGEGDLKAEYFLPSVVDGLVQAGKATVRVLPTNDRWFGVTYAEDKQAVIDAIATMDGVEGITGSYSFDEYNNPIKSAAIIEIKDGAEVFKEMY